jgi:hypothetical protein
VDVEDEVIEDKEDGESEGEMGEMPKEVCERVGLPKEDKVMKRLKDPPHLSD